MAKELNTKLLSMMVIKKRGKIGLRATADMVDISMATLSRIENGKVPDVDTFLRLCKWLEVAPGKFSISTIGSSNNDEAKIEKTKDVVISSLRADDSLDPKVMKALVEMVNVAYSYNPSN